MRQVTEGKNSMYESRRQDNSSCMKGRESEGGHLKDERPGQIIWDSIGQVRV